jgi:hypothetical protein
LCVRSAGLNAVTCATVTPVISIAATFSIATILLPALAFTALIGGDFLAERRDVAAALCAAAARTRTLWDWPFRLVLAAALAERFFFDFTERLFIEIL